MTLSHPTLIRRVPNGHRTAELRSLAQHRLIAEKLDAEVLRRARERVDGWLSTGGPAHPYWAKKWQELLNLPLGEIKRRLVEDTQEMRDMRQSSPFAGVLSQEERWKIIREVH